MPALPYGAANTRDFMLELLTNRGARDASDVDMSPRSIRSCGSSSVERRSISRAASAADPARWTLRRRHPSTKLVDHERLAVTHPWEHLASRRHLDERRDDPERNHQRHQRDAGIAMSIRLTIALKPWSGTSLILMTGRPSRSSSRAQGDDLADRHHLRPPLAARFPRSAPASTCCWAEERHRVIDGFARSNIGRLRDGRAAASRDSRMIARRPIVDEADDRRARGAR